MSRILFDFFKSTFSAPDHFEPNSAEQQFREDYSRRFLAHRRAISILAVVYWSAFTVWDIAQAFQNDEFQRVLTYVLALRIFGSACLAGCAWLSFRKSFVNEHYATNVLIATVAITPGATRSSAGRQIPESP